MLLKGHTAVFNNYVMHFPFVLIEENFIKAFQ